VLLDTITDLIERRLEESQDIVDTKPWLRDLMSLIISLGLNLASIQQFLARLRMEFFASYE